MRALVLIGALLLAAIAPASADAQGNVMKRIKEQAAARAKVRKDSMDNHLVRAATTAVDSAVGKTGRGVDSTVSKVGHVTDTLMNKTERGISGITRGGKENRIGPALANGRAVLAELAFEPGTVRFAASAAETLGQLAEALKATTGTWLIEAHVGADADPAAAQALTQERAVAVKADLVARGIPAERLFAMGLGATRPPTVGTPTTRIEVAKMQ
jgi:outer membrane protein OmpA-like peptidoglycan-associated protein